jgi:Xaa-Pro dipeptidase
MKGEIMATDDVSMVTAEVPLEEKRLWFSIDEYKERLRRVREVMGEKGLEVLISTTPENIYYMTGYETSGYYSYQCLIIPAEGVPMMLTRHLEEPNVRALSWIDQRRTIRDTQDPLQRTKETLQEMGLAEKRIGLELDSWFLTSQNYEGLKSILSEANIVDGSMTIESVRVIKSSQEIEYIRSAAKLASEAIRQAANAIDEGVSENDVGAVVYSTLLKGGSEYLAGGPAIASGPRSALAHATWSGRTILDGDIVFLELGASFHRYHGAHVRTVSVGEPSGDVRAKADAVIAGITAAVETIRPGVASDEVDRACRGAITRAGYGDYFLHRTGYSIGVAFQPCWGEGHIMALKGGDQRILKEGMTFHMVPAVMVYGEHGIGFSEMALVTKDGCEVLGNYPRELIVKK